jgi:hypothetical protein
MKAGGMGMRMAGGAINFMAAHPGMTMLGVGAAYAASPAIDIANDQAYGTSVMEDNPYGDLSEAQMNYALGQESEAAHLLSQSQVAPMGGMMPARQMLMGSTNGLVQGLHRGRHR